MTRMLDTGLIINRLFTIIIILIGCFHGLFFVKGRPMRGLFSKVSVTGSHLLSKADKKKYKALSNGLINIKDEYKQYIFSNKAKAIRCDGKSLFFEYYEYFCPTIRNFEESGFKRVCLNEGALQPLLNGSDVMVPGVLLFEHLCPSFEKDEVLGVEILNHGIVSVGAATMSLEEAKRVKNGVLIKILHVKGDYLYEETF